MSEKRGSDLVLISLKLPRSLLQDVDRAVKEGGYISRSDFIRHAVREFLEMLRKGV